MRRRWRSWSNSTTSRRTCRPGGSRRTAAGWRSASGATTRARSASCRLCVARSRTAPPRRSWPRSEHLVADGVLEVTLLGQNVNAYRYGGDARVRRTVARLRQRSTGLRRVRFTSPHPRDFTDDVIEAMAQTPNVMPQLHMPLQSGSDDVLRRMRRSYRADTIPRDPGASARAMPDAAITTDIIVGFPGETEEDFQHTLDVVREARFAGAFTFQYSPRPGTPAAGYPDQVPHDVVQERYERLVDVVDEIAWEENRALVGRAGRGPGGRGGGAQGRPHAAHVRQGSRRAPRALPRPPGCCPSRGPRDHCR